MTGHVVTRMVVAAGIGAVSLLGLTVPARAHVPQGLSRQEAQTDTGDQRGRNRADEEREKQRQQADKREAQARVRQQRQMEKRDAQEWDLQRARSLAQSRQAPRLAPQAQQVRIREQQQRQEMYRDQINRQQRLAQDQAARLQRQNRLAQYRFQQDYVLRLRQQQARIPAVGRYDYRHDPHFYAPLSYRYSRGGRNYETSQHGIDLLRQAVDLGYQEGCRAGLADRQDRWESNYQTSYAYEDANLGYIGFYVDRDDYNAYFREGFRRGYEDGYVGRYQHGSHVSGRGTILGAVLATILNFESIR